MTEQKNVVGTFKGMAKEERLRRASDSNTASKLLGFLLLNDPDEDVKTAAVKNPMTPIEDIAEYSLRTPFHLRNAENTLIRNPHCPSELLSKFAKDAPKDFSVREMVFDNPNLPSEHRCQIAREFLMWEKALKNSYVPLSMKDLIQRKLDNGDTSISDEEMNEILLEV